MGPWRRVVGGEAAEAEIEGEEEINGFDGSGKDEDEMGDDVGEERMQELGDQLHG